MKNLILCFLLISFLGYAKEQNVIAVIGGGPSGLSAANTCQELGFQTILFEQTKEPNLEDTVSFWPGLAAPKWGGIIKTMQNTFTKSGGAIIEKEALGISQDADGFRVTTAKEFFPVKAVIMATGKQPRSSSLLFQKSDRVLTDPWNGKLFSPKDSVIIIGQGEPLFHACLNAARSAGHVIVMPYQANTLSLDPLAKIFPSISIIRGASIIEIGYSKGKVYVTYFHEKAKLYREASYIIVAEEKDPSSYLVENLCDLDSTKAIVSSNDTGATSLPGIFACGEVTRKQALTGLQATADGQKVGLAVAYFLVSKGIAPKRTFPLTPPPEKEPQGPTGPEEPQGGK